MWLVLLTLLVLRHISNIKASMDYNKFQSITHTPSTSAYITSALEPVNYEAQKASWTPTISHNNWIILHSASNDAVAVEEVPLENSPHHIAQVTTSSLNNYAQHITQQQQGQQRQQYPLKYYTYNSASNGNYHLPSKDFRKIEPYVLTISNQRNQIMPFSVSNNNGEQRQQSINNRNQNTSRSDDVSYQWLTKNVRTFNNHNNPGYLYIESNNSKLQNKHNNGVHNSVTKHSSIVQQQGILSLFDGQDIVGKVKNENMDIDKSPKIETVENIINSMENEGFSEVLMPLGKILDKVKYYCEVLKEIINGDVEDLINNDLVPLYDGETATRTASASSTEKALDTTQLMAAQVQGRHTTAHNVGHLIMQQSAETKLLSPTTTILNMPRSTEITASPPAPANINTTNLATTIATSKSLASAALFIGRGKKFKKKLKKFILPLLLAYKLKFLALVPLLVGGLTLLVGSTGLAGFFFALFVTVMALKGGGGGNADKSIVINKEW